MRVSLLFQLFVQSFQPNPLRELPFVPRVTIRQALSKRRGNTVKGSRNIGRFFDTFYCFRASRRVPLFFILYPICTARGRGLSSIVIVYLLLCILFLNRVFSVRKIANSFSKHCCNRRAWHAISCVLNNIKVSFKERECDISSLLHYFLSSIYL